MTQRSAIVDRLESRQLLSFTHLDPGFGSGGSVAVGSTTSFQHIYATDDGGSVVLSDGHQFRRLDAAGRVITSFGKNGVLAVDSNSYGSASAVDRATGRIALVTQDSHGIRSLEFYSSRGKLERSTPLSALGPDITADAIAFDGQGRLVVAQANSVARILPATATLDRSFAADGVFELPTLLINDGTSGGGLTSTVSVLSVFAARDGTITLVRERAYETNDEESAADRFTHRINANGTPTTSFGTDGILSESAGSYTVEDITYYTDRSIGLLDTALMANGSMLRLLQKSLVSDYGSSQYHSTTLVLEQRDAAGELTKSLDLTGILRPEREFTDGSSGTGMLRLDGSGHAYVVFASRVVRIDAKSLMLDAAYNGSTGGATLGSISGVADIALDTKGRLLVVGNPRRADATYAPATVRAIDGTTETFGSKSGTVTLLAGGVLDVAGTSKKDQVIFSRPDATPGQLEVSLNGKRSRFKFSDITGIVIHTGKGNDTIDVSGGELYIGVTVQAGDGNDRVKGTSFEDLLDGGVGNDTLDGLGGSDFLYGGAGNDSLRGGTGGDYLYGGGNSDKLIANDEAGSDDDFDNYLFGGTSKDTFITSSHAYGNYHNQDQTVQ